MWAPENRNKPTVFVQSERSLNFHMEYCDPWNRTHTYIFFSFWKARGLPSFSNLVFHLKLNEVRSVSQNVNLKNLWSFNSFTFCDVLVWLFETRTPMVTQSPSISPPLKCKLMVHMRTIFRPSILSAITSPDTRGLLKMVNTS